MDIVGIGVVGTFFAMLAVSVFGMQSQKPPSTAATTHCPATDQPVHVSLMWNGAERSLAVESCDGQEFKHGCKQTCLASLNKTQPVIAQSRVIG